MRKKILFLANHFITLFSFRKELIRELVDSGYDVYLSLPTDSANEYFENMGCKIIPTNIDRRGVNPLEDIQLIRSYKKIVNEIKPDIVFSYTIKPNIYGAFACNGKYRQVCNVTGTGATFLKTNFVSQVAKLLYRLTLPQTYKVFFQNAGDKEFFVRNRMVGNNYEIIPGSGCNIEEYTFQPMPEDDIVKFMYIGRVMKLKGIDEYLEAAKIVKCKYPCAEFLIAGWNEEEDYIRIVSDYEKEGYVKYIGFRNDIREQLINVHCVVLPSHGGEGVPNVLLESSATGRVCIGSKVNGTIDVIEDEHTGYLFEPGNTLALADKMEKFLNLTPQERTMMGNEGRKKVEREFDRRIVIQKYIQEVERC